MVKTFLAKISVLLALAEQTSSFTVTSSTYNWRISRAASSADPDPESSQSVLDIDVLPDEYRGYGLDLNATSAGAFYDDGSDPSALLDTSPSSHFESAISRKDFVSISGIVAAVAVGQCTGFLSNRTSRQTGSAFLPKGNLETPNFTKVAQETRINITMECGASPTCVSIDTTTFQKKQSLRLPSWLPQSLVPPAKVIRDITNSELLISAIIAGSAMEIARTSLLYPISTLKTRVQTDVSRRRVSRKTDLSLRRRIRILQLNAIRHYREGSLFAGITPTLLVAVPATGVYCGVRDVAKRSLTSIVLDDVWIAVLAAFLADIISLIVRTPGDALAIRLQSLTGEEARQRGDESKEELQASVDAKVGSWFSESIDRIPVVILTDLPYLLSRIALNRLLIHGPLDIGRYELLSISTALLCGFLTTPFDVVRTRILVDSDDDPTNGIDGGLLGIGEGADLTTAFKRIMQEGNGGVSNLFAGWFERIAYLGIGRAWLEPLQIVGYIALRDTILLEWFD